MDLEQKIINVLDGRYDYDTVEYFDLSIQDRDNIAKAIVNQFFWKLKVDKGYYQFYKDFIDFRMNELLKEEKYEALDLYKRLLNEIILMNY
jgi:ABC-type long-subunit fatty acid transport system fused permease/ATPase subunit